MADDDLHNSLRKSPPTPRRNGVLENFSGIGEGLRQLDAVMHGASDVIPFRAADGLASLAYAIVGPRNWKERFDASMAAEAARDREDAVRYPTARAIGELGLTAAALGRGSKLTGVLAAPRLPGAARITSREALSMLGAGGAVGVGTQALGDAATSKRSSPGDYAGAGIGGVAGVLALPKGPERAAAFDGAVTSMAQDLFNSRPVSLQQAGQSAVAARTAGALASKAAMNWAENLPSATKGKLGETLGALRGVADWQPRIALGKTPVRVPGTSKSWKPDAMRGSSPNAADARLYEDKFGRKADLRPNQRLARAVLGDNFQLNHFLPRDVGKAAASFAAALGIQGHQRTPPPPRR